MVQDGLELEESDFHPDFKEYAKRELKWSRLDISGKPDDDYADECPNHDCRWQGIRWVFWSRQDDHPERPLYHDNFVGSISDACPSPEVIREKITLALHQMILDPCLNEALVQFWAPTKILEGRTFLTTQHQPFALGKTLKRDDRRRLCEYRMEMCREYNNCFYAGSGEDQLGVPGRLFLHKFPEFNLDVQHYSLKECPQRDLALRCRIGGYLAVPVFDRSSQTCVGVLEISFLYHLLAIYGYKKDFLRHVFDRFQKFGLQCFSRCEDQVMRDEDEDKDEDKNKALAVAFKELQMVLESVCKIHKLPFAITWVPCSTCDHLFHGQNLFKDQDFFEGDFSLMEYKEMLKTCHLRKGQVTGSILTFPKLSYCSDVKQFSISEYPWVNIVRSLKLSGCFTMCLQSSRTRSELYVLEFFLCKYDNILTRLSSILRTVEKNSHTFKLACSQEFGGGLSVEVIDFPNGQRSHSIRMIEATRVFPTLVPLEDGGGMLQLDQPDQPSMDAVNSRMNGVSAVQNYNLLSFEPLQNGELAMQLDSFDQLSMDPANNGQDVFTAQRNILAVTSSEESKRKTQKIEHRKIGVRIEVPLEDILKCSKMSRDAAARKLKVSISTLKRLCRYYGINRWPPRNMDPGLPSNQVSAQEETPRLSSDLPSNQVSAQEQTPRLSSDLPSNQVSASVVPIKPACQDYFPTLDPLKDGGGMLQLDQPDQPSMDAVNSRMNVVGEAQNYNLPSFEPLQNREVAMQLDSFDQLSMDPANNGHDVFTAQRNILAVTSSEESKRKTQKIEHSKIGVRIEVPSEDIFNCSKMSRDDAARKLEVGTSTSEHVGWDYGINRWPPRNMKEVHSSRLLPSENQEQTSRLSSDSSNQVSASVERKKAACQDEDVVMIKAKYEKYTIKFQLSLLSTLVELHQEVAKRLHLEAGSYYVKYKDEEDEEDELILMACDEDLQDFVHRCRSVGKTSIVVQLEPKQTS